jgi:hypothetical protein
MKPQDDSDPALVELISTQDLINELHRRSRVLFIAARPMAKEAFDWRRSWSVDGGRTDKPESITRVLGLVQVTVNDMLNPKRTRNDG